MQSVSYWEAWSLWWSGHKVDGFQMWGLPLLWWGRIGKLLQFAGGLVVVLDLIGSMRLRCLRESIDTARRQVSKAARSKSSDEPERTKRLAYRLGAVSAVFAVTILVIIVNLIGTAQLDILLDKPQAPLDSILKIAFVLLLPVMLGYMLVRLVSPLLGALVWVFNSERPGHPMRWTAFALVVAGFHFDLLAS